MQQQNFKNKFILVLSIIGKLDKLVNFAIIKPFWSRPTLNKPHNTGKIKIGSDSKMKEFSFVLIFRYTTTNPVKFTWKASGNRNLHNQRHRRYSFKFQQHIFLGPGQNSVPAMYAIRLSTWLYIIKTSFDIFNISSLNLIRIRSTSMI